MKKRKANLVADLAYIGVTGEKFEELNLFCAVFKVLSWKDDKVHGSPLEIDVSTRGANVVFSSELKWIYEECRKEGEFILAFPAVVVYEVGPLGMCRIEYIERQNDAEINRMLAYAGFGDHVEGEP